VLLIAEGCNPEMTSVPLEGFSHSEAIRQVADALVLTHWRNTEDLQKVGWVLGKDFEIIDTEKAARVMWDIATFLRGGHGKGWTTLTALSTPLYYLFEHIIWKNYRRRLEAGEFDLVHRLIPLSPTTPSLLASHCKKIGVPFVVGPLNGGVPWPKGFDVQRRREKEWLSYLRSAYKLLPGYRSMRASASAILVGSRDTMKQMPRGCQDRCFYIPENAIDPQRFSANIRTQRTGENGKPIQIIFVGRLVPYKGADMLIEAAAPLLREGKIEVTIIGDGPQRPTLESLVQQHQVAGKVHLRGWVDHRQVHQCLSEADILGFPSIREFGGAVVLEAMAVGVVPIVVDYGGPAELVTPSTGYLLPLGSREQIVASLRSCLQQVVARPQEIDSRRSPAQRRAREQFTWESKAKLVSDVYQWVLGQTAKKPQIPMPLPDLPAQAA
jgi:glycosyltransferase involved in cell wall biosynthesis